MADDEITVTIPDNEPDDDANNNGISDGIEVGRAVEQAENAEEQAENAEFTADVAMAVADDATQIAYATETRVAELEALNDAQTVRINELMTTVAGLVDVTTNLANVALAEKETAEFQELPPDETLAQPALVVKAVVRFTVMGVYQVKYSQHAHRWWAGELDEDDNVILVRYYDTRVEAMDDINQRMEAANQRAEWPVIDAQVFQRRAQ